MVDLRATILQLAVQGRLVQQNPDDEPASDLLKRIESEKARLIEAGEIKRSKPLPPIGEDEAPYARPDGWVWSSFEQLAESVPNSLKAGPFGSALKKEFYTGTGYKVYGQERWSKRTPRYDATASCQSG